MSCHCRRWAFRFGQWEPSQAEWLMACQFIQVEELSRAKKFIYREDVASAVAGRLLLRQAVKQCQNAAWGEIRMERTSRGKPFVFNPVCGPDASPFSVNISHHGEYAVLAASCSPHVGVDVMNTKRPMGSRSVDDYLEMMKRKFSIREWTTMQNQIDADDKLAAFYRLWTLKESYIKATGVGLIDALETLDFELPETAYGGYKFAKIGTSISGTKLHLHPVGKDGGKPVDTSKLWTFHESELANHHLVAVCRDHQLGVECKFVKQSNEPMEFEELSFKDLIDGAERLHCASLQEFVDFTAKLSRKKSGG